MASFLTGEEWHILSVPDDTGSVFFEGALEFAANVHSACSTPFALCCAQCELITHRTLLIIDICIFKSRDLYSAQASIKACEYDCLVSQWMTSTAAIV